MGLDEREEPRLFLVQQGSAVEYGPRRGRRKPTRRLDAHPLGRHGDTRVTTTDVADDLVSARDAYSRGDWRSAYEHFNRAHQTSELNTDDLSSFGMAAWRLGCGRESIQLSEQAFNRLIAENE